MKIAQNGARIFVTSDLHLCHDREFIWGPRGFKSVKEMNNAIVQNWNKTVSKEDHVIVLGDLMLNNNDLGLFYLKQLNGTLHLIRGNHDTDARLPLYFNCSNVDGLRMPYAETLEYLEYKFYLSHYPTITANHDEQKPLKNQVINLCGHCHTPNKFADMDKGLIYHCELDAHNMTPVCIDEILVDIYHYKRRKEGGAA